MGNFDEECQKKIKDIELQLDRNRETAIENLEKATAQADQLELIGRRANNLSRLAEEFKTSATAIKRAMCKRKCIIILGSVVSIAVFILI